MNAHLSCAYVFLLACGEPTIADRERGSSAMGAPGGARSTDMVLAYRAPSAVIEMRRGALDFAGQVIERASALSGAPTARTFGTLREETNGNLTYQNAPADRLIVERSDGRRFEIMVAEIIGSGGDVASFFRANHVLRVEMVAEGIGCGALFHSERLFPRLRDPRASGRRWPHFNVDLKQEGTESFDSDQSGSRFYDEHALSGTMDRDGDHVEVQERWTFELVSAQGGASDTRMETASSTVRSVESIGTIGGRGFEWRNVRTRKAFRNGKPNELDTFWDGTGEVLVDGTVVGKVMKFVDAYGESGGFVGFNLITSDSPIELERFSAY